MFFLTFDKTFKQGFVKPAFEAFLVKISYLNLFELKTFYFHFLVFRLEMQFCTLSPSSIQKAIFN